LKLAADGVAVRRALESVRQQIDALRDKLKVQDRS
jgi:hypothetical protein